jgi:RNA polymerase sigma factor (sigma-70 family)
MEHISEIRQIGKDRERLFVEQLALIERLTRSVARQHRLSADEAEEFTATVLLRLIVDDYAVLRKFRWQCSLPTFLTIVIRRMCLDFRDAQWGKWRASAASRRHGDVAIRLERLTMRDGLTFEEACAVLESERGMTLDRETLACIYSQFRVRARPRFVSDDELCDVQAAHGSPERPMIETEHAAVLSSAMSVLADTMRTFTLRDRLLLQLRFADDLPVATVARLMRMDQKRLYRRYAQLFARLRKDLETHGVAARQIVPVLGQTTSGPHMFLDRYGSANSVLVGNPQNSLSA